MTKINYLKPYTEIKDDFKKLSIMQQQAETTFLFNKYLKLSTQDFKLIGKNTTQTKKIWDLYEKLNNVFMKRIEAWVEKDLKDE